MKIPFNRACKLVGQDEYVAAGYKNLNFETDGVYAQTCVAELKKFYRGEIFLTGSCTQALEAVSYALNLSEDDEIICPAFTFVSTILPFTNRGAKAVFTDVSEDSLSITLDCIQNAYSPRTRAVLVVHYGGLPADLRAIREFCDSKQIILIEDCAHIPCFVTKEYQVGNVGDFSVFSWHHTKNFTSGGEGGALVVNNSGFIEAVHIARDKGTNRRKLIEGSVDKYTWIGAGGSLLMPEVSALSLSYQLQSWKLVHGKRKYICTAYRSIVDEYGVSYFSSAEGCGHIFGVILSNVEERESLKNRMARNGISCHPHYVNLANSPFGKKYASGISTSTTDALEHRFLRLPVYYQLSDLELEWICECLSRNLVSVCGKI